MSKVIHYPYMIRRKFFIPKIEYMRNYNDGHTVTPQDIICKCDRVDDDGQEYE